MALKTVDITDHAAWYSARRDELLALMKETTALDIPPEYKMELAASHKKCLENQFEIVLVGEFQGGKSTTFNTLCGGRDLSPRGLNGGGIKTSAAVITAQNISDGETRDGMEEWAEITIKSKQKLQAGMFDVLAKIGKIQDTMPKIKLETEKDFLDNLDLDNPAHRKAMKDVLSKMWANGWDQNCPNLKKGDMTQRDLQDNMRIATLVLNFYGTKGYQDLCQKKITDIYAFQKMIQFPEGWEKKWCDKANANFSFDEISFVFISRALLRIKSEHLARLGCKITDCPGLFANAYDTRVAKEAIRNADAAWHLLKADTQLGDADLKILGEIKNMGINDRIFLSGNMKSDHKQKIANIIPVAEDQLRNAGLGDCIHPYNARLAFLSEQGNLIIDKKLADHDKKNMEIDSDMQGKTPEAMWLKMTRKIGNMIDIDAIAELEELDKEAIKTVKDESRLEDILTPLNERIIRNQAKSILLDNGSTRAAKALEGYEGDLQSTENAAQENEEIAKKRKAEADQKLKDFLEAAQELIDKAPFVVNKIENAYFYSNQLLKDAFNSNNILSDITKKILVAAYKKKDEMFLNSEEYQKDVLKSVSPEISGLLNDAILDAWGNWRNEGGVSAWQKKHLAEIKKTNKDIENKWKDVKCDNIPLLRGLGDFKLPSLDADITNAISAIASDANIKDAIKASQNNFLQTIWSWLKKLFGGDTEKDFENAHEGNVFSAVHKALTAQNLQSVQISLERTFSNHTETVEKNLRDKLKLIETSYDQRVKEGENTRKKASEKRKEIADRCRKIRTEKIEPVRKKLQAYEAKVSQEVQGL